VKPGGIVLWDLSTAKERLRLRLPRGKVTSLIFTSDSQVLISGGGEPGKSGEVRFWDVTRGRLIGASAALGASIDGMTIAPDGRTLTASGGGQWLPTGLRHWDLPTELNQVVTLPAHSAAAQCAAFAPDSQTLATAGADQQIKLWDTHSGVELTTLRGHTSGVRAVAFSPDGETLASAGDDCCVKLWDVSTGKEKKSWKAHSLAVYGLAFAPGGKQLATCSGDFEKGSSGEVKLWDAATRTEIGTVPLRWRAGDRRVVFAPDGQTLVLEDDGKLNIYTVPELQAVTNWPGFLPAYSQDGSALVYALRNPNRVVRRHLATGQEVRIGDQADGVRDLALSPDGKTVATSADSGGIITFWDALGQSPPVTVTNHTQRVWMVAFSPDGQTLASASWDGKLGLWNVKERRNLALLRGHKGEMSSVAFSPDGRTVATSSEDKTVRLWNLETRREIAVLRHPGNVYPLVFSPNGQWLVTGCEGTIRFWHAPTFEEIAAAQNTKEKRQ